jgi:hypothetical protein
MTDRLDVPSIYYFDFHWGVLMLMDEFTFNIPVDHHFSIYSFENNTFSTNLYQEVSK